MTKKLRVVVADDHAMITDSLSSVLPALTDGTIEVVGSTQNAGELADLVKAEEPDVALVDLAMPPPGGIGAIREVVTSNRKVGILAVSGTVNVDAALAALAAGASGFVHKNEGPDALVDPIRVIARGGCVVPRELLDRMVRASIGPAVQQARQLPDSDLHLLRLVASGKSADEMAEELYVSTRTLKRNLSSLYEKLDVNTRQEAAAFAGRAGLLDE